MTEASRTFLAALNRNLTDAEALAGAMPDNLRAAANVDNVDNTSDANKPVSTAMQAALNLKASTTALQSGLTETVDSLTRGFYAWASNYVGIRPIPTVMSSPPTITIGTSNAVSAITGAANDAVMIGPTSTKLTWPGVAPTLVTTGYYGGARTGKRVRFRFSGRRFEMRLRSSFALMPSIIVDGQVTTRATVQAGMNNSGNHLVLVDFGSNTEKQKAVSVQNVAAGGSGYAVGDEITLAGGTSTTAAVLRVIAVTGGAVSGLSIKTPGEYTVIPSNAVAQASTTGGGTGCTATMIWAKTHTTIAPRSIEIVLPGSCSFGGLNTDANDTVTEWPESETAPKLLITGDSFTESQQVDYIAGTWARQVAYRLGLEDRFVAYGTSGRGYLQTSTFATDLDGIIAEAPDMVVVALGVNDCLTEQNTTTLTTTVTSNIQTLMTALPDARFVVLSPWFVNSLPQYTTAIQSGVAALTDQTRVRFIDLQTNVIFVRGFTALDYMCSDNLHPTQTGHDYLCNALAPLIADAFAEMA